MAIYPKKTVRKREFGGTSKMTLHRWRKDGFPDSIVINGRNYYSDKHLVNEIPAFLKKKMGERSSA